MINKSGLSFNTFSIIPSVKPCFLSSCIIKLISLCCKSSLINLNMSPELEKPSISDLYTLAFAIFLFFYSSFLHFLYFSYFLYILVSSVDDSYILSNKSILDFVLYTTFHLLFLLSFLIILSLNDDIQ